MSRFLSKKHADLAAYVPGEQPQDQQYVKLNTNESPFPPSPKAQERAMDAIKKLQLYPDPDCKQLAARTAKHLNAKEKVSLATENVILTNGSDEILNFAFMAFCDADSPAIFPDITYGFYPVFADMNKVPYREIPLDENFRIDPEDYYGAGGTIFIANPNAHTGICLTPEQLEKVIENNPENVVIVDEAYVDFGAESCVPLIEKFNNLLVIQTLSKSRSLAGARLGFGAGNAELVSDLNTIRNSTNPYNINSVTMAAGIGVFDDEKYTQDNCRAIIENRNYTTSELRKMGFELTDSRANFIFMKHHEIDGGKIYKTMKEKGVLIRHFNKERIRQYNRVTIGSRKQMETFIKILAEVVEELK